MAISAKICEKCGNVAEGEAVHTNEHGEPTGTLWVWCCGNCGHWEEA